jgi:hypothetical protein
MKLTGENRSTRRRTSPSATLSTTNPTWSDPGRNTGLRGGRPVANRLSHGTAHFLTHNSEHKTACFYKSLQGLKQCRTKMLFTRQNVLHFHVMKAYRGSGSTAPLILTSDLHGGEWLTSRCVPLTPAKEARQPLNRMLGGPRHPLVSFWKFRFVSFRFPSLFYLLVHSQCRGLLFSLDHTQAHTTVGRTPLDEGSARRRDLYLTTQTLYKRQTSMPAVGFEPMILARERPQTYTLDRAAIGIGSVLKVRQKLKWKCLFL